MSVKSLCHIIIQVFSWLRRKFKIVSLSHVYMLTFLFFPQSWSKLYKDNEVKVKKKKTQDTSVTQTNLPFSQV